MFIFQQALSLMAPVAKWQGKGRRPCAPWHRTAGPLLPAFTFSSIKLLTRQRQGPPCCHVCRPLRHAI